MSLLLFLMFATMVVGKGVEESKSFEPFVGDYYPVYSWPGTSYGADSDDCKNATKYRTLEYKEHTPYTCHCGRPDADLALITEETVMSGYKLTVPYVADIVRTPSQFSSAIDDDCYCSPVTYIVTEKMVFRKLNENFILRGEKIPLIYGKYIPNDDELKTLVDKVDEMRGKVGGRACPVKNN